MLFISFVLFFNIIKNLHDIFFVMRSPNHLLLYHGDFSYAKAFYLPPVEPEVFSTSKDTNKILRRSVYLSGGINIYSVVIIAVLIASSQFTLYHKFSDRNLNGTITLHDYNFIPSMLLYTMGFYAMLLKTLAVQVCQLLPSANFLHKLLWRQMLLIQP